AQRDRVDPDGGRTDRSDRHLVDAPAARHARGLRDRPGRELPALAQRHRSRRNAACGRHHAGNVAWVTPRARFGAQLRESARDGWAVGGAAFALARSARSIRPYVAGALAIVLVAGAALGATGVALRHHGTILQRIVFGLLSAYVMAVLSNAAAVGLAGL